MTLWHIKQCTPGSFCPNHLCLGSHWINDCFSEHQRVSDQCLWMLPSPLVLMFRMESSGLWLYWWSWCSLWVESSEPCLHWWSWCSKWRPKKRHQIDRAPVICLALETLSPPLIICYFLKDCSLRDLSWITYYTKGMKKVEIKRLCIFFRKTPKIFQMFLMAGI